MSKYVCFEDVGKMALSMMGISNTEWVHVIQGLPTIEIVRCKECKHRIVNEHYGEKGYIKLKAMCELDTGDIFQLGRHAEDDEWYCADGEREGE